MKTYYHNYETNRIREFTGRETGIECIPYNVKGKMKILFDSREELRDIINGKI